MAESFSERYRRLKAEQDNSASSSIMNRYKELAKQREGEGIYNDISALNPMLQNATSSWQNAETMASTKNSLADTLKRMNSYKSAYGASMDEAYAKSFDDTLNGYQELFDNWDALSNRYSVAQSAEDFENILNPKAQELTEAEKANKERMDTIMQNAEAFGKAHPFLGSLASLGTGFIGGIPAFTSDLASAMSYQGIDANNPMHTLANMSTAYQNGVASEMNPVGQFAYQTGMSTLNSLGNMFLGGAGLANIASQAYAQNVKEMQDGGASDEQAFIQSLLSGAIEVVTENFSITKLKALDKKLQAGTVDGVKSIVKEIAKQMIAEDEEEMTSEVLNKTMDAIAMGLGGYSQIAEDYKNRRLNGADEETAFWLTFGRQLGDVGLAGLGGAISGGILGGGDVALRYRGNVNTGTSFSQNGDVEALKGIANDLGLDTSRLDKKVTPAKVGATVNEIREEAVKRNDVTPIVKTAIASKGSTAFDSKTNKEVNITGLRLENNKIVVDTSEGTRDIDELSSAGLIVTDFEIKNKKAFVDNYRGGNLGEYFQAYERAYNYGEIGYTNIDAENWVRKNIVNGTITSETLKNIVEAGMMSDVRKAEKRLQKIVKTFGDIATESYVDTSVISFDGRNKEKVNFKTLSDNQKAGIAIISALAKEGGINVTFSTSTKENGYYDPSTNTISVSLFAKQYGGITSENAMLTTFSHELTHWMKTKAPTEYRNLQNAVMEALAKENGNSTEELIEAETERLLARDKVTEDKIEDVYDEYQEIAIEELVARACEDMLSNSDYAQSVLSSLDSEKQKGLVNAIKNFLKKVREALSNFLNRFDSASPEAKAIRKYEEAFKEIESLWDKAFERARETTSTIDSAIKAKILSEDSTSTALRFNENTWETQGRSFLANYARENGFTDDEVNALIANVDRIKDAMNKRIGDKFESYTNWANAEFSQEELDAFSVIVNNGEYELNIDFATVCKKREVLDMVLNTLVKSGDLNLYTLTGTDINKINAIIKKKGFEIACGLCSVDSKRYRVGSWAKSFADKYNPLINKLAKENGITDIKEFNYTEREGVNDSGENLLENVTKFENLKEVVRKETKVGKDKKTSITERGKIAQALIDNPSLRKRISKAEIIASEGLDTIKLNNSALFALVNDHGGSGKPKLSLSRTAYTNDILENNKFTFDKASSVGGVRIQSFSDYVPIMVFDYVQLISELEAKGLPAHAYTKELSFAKLFGLTGIKINLSAIPKGVAVPEGWLNIKGSKVSVKSEFKRQYELASRYVGFKINEEGYPIDKNGNEITRKAKWEDFTEEEKDRLQYATDDESINLEEAIKLQNTEGYDKNVGVVFVGASDIAIWKMLDDPNISMIIPYHKSNINPVVASLRNIYTYNDYTRYQHTRDKETGNNFKKEPYDWYGNLQKFGDARLTANDYLKQCDENGWIPKFDKFRSHPNYYKLLEDFRMYDMNGQYAPQEKVKLNLPADHLDIISESIGKYDEDMKSLKNGKFDEILKEVRGVIGGAKRNSDNLGVIEKKAVSHFGTTDRFNVAGYMLTDGTMLDFSGQHWLEGWSKAEIEKWKKQNDIRQVDHEDIYEVFPSNDNSGDNRLKFMKRGNIRMSPEGSGINILKDVEPTKAQYAKLKEFINEYCIPNYEEFYVDIEGKGHEKIAYTGKFSAERVLNDIKEFYETGVVPKGNEDSLSAFLSDRMRYSKYDTTDFSKQIDEWVSKNKPATVFELGRTSESKALTEIGVPDFKLILKSIKLNKSMKKHPELTEEVVKQIPFMIKNPISLHLSYSEGHEDRVIAVSDLYKKEVTADDDKTRSPIIVPIEIYPYDDAEKTWEIIIGEAVAVSAYGRENWENFLNNATLLWVNPSKKRTSDFEKATRLQSSITASNTGLIQSITYDPESASEKRIKLAYQNAINDGDSQKASDILAEMTKKGIPLNSDIISELHPEADEVETDADADRLLAEYEQKTKEALAKQKEELKAKFDEQYKRRVLREKIYKRATALTKLLKNDKDAHIPDVLKEPLKNFVGSLDFTVSNVGDSKANVEIQNNFLALTKELVSYQQAKEDLENEYFDFSNDLIENLETISDVLQKLISDKVGAGTNVIRKLDSARLGLLNETLVAFQKSVNRADKALRTDRLKATRGYARDAYHYLEKLEGAMPHKFGITDSLLGWLNWENVIPAYIFDRFGDGGKAMFREMMEADEKLAFNSIKARDDIAKMFTPDEANEWLNETHSFTVGDKDFKMTTAQIMSLYCLDKREASHQHLYTVVKNKGRIDEETLNGDGIVIPAITGKDKQAQTSVIHVTRADVKKITDTLTDRQKESADMMQSYLSNECSMWGNYVSMHRFGMLQFTEKNYFPMHTYFVGKAEGKEQMEATKIFRLLNQGFTKSLNDKATNALIIDDIFSTFSRHVQDMATLNAYGLPVLDMYNWLSYKRSYKDKEGNVEKHSLREQMDRVYGTRAYKWMTRYLEDLNGNVYNQYDIDKFARFVMKNYKASAVAGNLRVAVMQPCSIVRALDVMDGKYIRKALTLRPSELKTIEERRNKNSGISVWKEELGQFDNAVSREIMKDVVNTKTKLSRFYERGMELAMKPAEIGDKITWNILYKACEIEVKETHPNLDENIYTRMVAERFADVIHRTQVVNSVNTRTALMKSKNIFHQMATAFMAEPSVSYSMLNAKVFDFMIDARSMGKRQAFAKHKDDILRTSVVFLLNSLAVSVMASIFDASRNRDDDEKWIEAYAKNVLENVLQESTSLLPYFKEINGVFTGFTSSRMDLAVTDDIIKAVRTLSNGTWNYKDVKALAKAVSSTTGVPVSNVMREFVTLWDNLMDMLGYTDSKINK